MKKVRKEEDVLEKKSEAVVASEECVCVNWA
jgi:hypothetical protein